MDENFETRALGQSLTPSELEALRIVARGGSVRDFARSLSTDIAKATEFTNSMKLKLGAVRDADALRVAIYAGIAD